MSKYIRAFFAQFLGGNLRHIASKTLSFFKSLSFFGKFLEFFKNSYIFFWKINCLLGKFHKHCFNTWKFLQIYWKSQELLNKFWIFLSIFFLIFKVASIAWIFFYQKLVWVFVKTALSFWKRAKNTLKYMKTAKEIAAAKFHLRNWILGWIWNYFGRGSSKPQRWVARPRDYK